MSAKAQTLRGRGFGQTTSAFRQGRGLKYSKVASEPLEAIGDPSRDDGGVNEKEVRDVKEQSKYWFSVSGFFIFGLALTMVIVHAARVIYDEFVTSADFPSLGYQATNAPTGTAFFGAMFIAHGLLRMIIAAPESVWGYVASDLLGNKLDFLVVDALFSVATPVVSVLMQAALTNIMFILGYGILAWGFAAHLLSGFEMDALNLRYARGESASGHWTSYIFALITGLLVVVCVMGYGISQAVYMQTTIGATGRQAMLIVSLSVVSFEILVLLVAQAMRYCDMESDDGWAGRLRNMHNYLRGFAFLSTAVVLTIESVHFSRGFIFT